MSREMAPTLVKIVPVPGGVVRYSRHAAGAVTHVIQASRDDGLTADG